MLQFGPLSRRGLATPIREVFQPREVFHFGWRCGVGYAPGLVS